MHNKFNTFIKNGLLINLGIVLIAIITITGYTKGNDIKLSDVFQEGSFFKYNGQFYSRNFFSSNNNSSDYRTSNFHQEDTFSAHENINIRSNSETISFVYEDRDDILVVYDHEMPETERYRLDYNADEDKNAINITSSLDVRNLFTDIIYDGSITLHVPMDYQCDTLNVDSSYGDINDSIIPTSVNHVKISSNAADVELHINQVVEDLSIDINVGSIDLIINQPISIVGIQGNTSDASVTVNSAIEDLDINIDVGSVDLVLNESPESVKVSANVGDVNVNYYDYVNTLEAIANLGSIYIDVLEDESSLVYKNTNLSDVNSDLVTISDKNKAQIHIEIDLGSIDIDAIN